MVIPVEAFCLARMPEKTYRAQFMEGESYGQKEN